MEVTSTSENDLSPLFPCKYKEADIQIFVHLSHAAQNGIKRTLIKTIKHWCCCYCSCSNLEIDELQTEFRAGKKQDE